MAAKLRLGTSLVVLAILRCSRDGYLFKPVAYAAVRTAAANSVSGTFNLTQRGSHYAEDNHASLLRTGHHHRRLGSVAIWQMVWHRDWGPGDMDRSLHRL
jgi:hypothetical protein